MSSSLEKTGPIVPYSYNNPPPPYSEKPQAPPVYSVLPQEAGDAFVEAFTQASPTAFVVHRTLDILETEKQPSWKKYAVICVSLVAFASIMHLSSQISYLRLLANYSFMAVPLANVAGAVGLYAYKIRENNKKTENQQKALVLDANKMPFLQPHTDTVKTAVSAKTEKSQGFTTIAENSFFSDLQKALYRRDLDYILAQKDTRAWNDLSAEELSQMHYTLFHHVLIYNDPVESEKGKELIKSLFIFHPNAEISARKAASLLGSAMTIGNSAIAKFIKEEHPCWSNMTDQQLASILKENLTVAEHPGNPKDFSINLQFQGKKEILDLLLTHPNWNTTDVKYLRTYIESILKGFLPKNTTISYLQHFRTYSCWDQITNHDIAYYLSSNINHPNTGELFLFFQEHPNWNRLNHLNLTQLTLAVIVDRPTAQDALFSMISRHPNWTTLNTFELSMIAHEAFCHKNTPYLSILSQHHNWNNMSPDELVNIIKPITFGSYTLESIEIICSHPSWPLVNKNEMVSIATVSVKYEQYNLFDKVTNHPTWPQFTNNDLQRILRAAEHAYSGHPCEKIEEIKSIIFSHPNWEGTTY